MVAHPEDFKDFIAVNNGQGGRRNPKRKTAGSMQSQVPKAPTQAQINKTFMASMKRMAQGGTYGDNAEIVAFTRAYDVSVKVYEESSGRFISFPEDVPENSGRPTAYIVHHVSPPTLCSLTSIDVGWQTWEHFSSLRNINGPHTGLPNVVYKELSPEAKAHLADVLAEGVHIEPWMVDIVMKSVPWPQNLPANRTSVEQTLKQCNGNINHAVALLLPDSSPESSSRSSSIERDPDSDDERSQKPNKKRDRRISRPHPLRNDLAVHLGSKDQNSPDPRHLAAALQSVASKDTDFDPDETEEENWQDGSQQSKESESSSSTSASEYSNVEPVKDSARLKLKPPKKQGSKSAGATTASAHKSEQLKQADSNVDTEQNSQQKRVKAKPKRRLISGNQRNKELAEQAARNSSNQKLDMQIQAIHI